MARPPEQGNLLEYSVREKTTDLFCDEAESFGMEARCWNWYPKVQKVAHKRGAWPRYVRILSSLPIYCRFPYLLHMQISLFTAYVCITSIWPDPFPLECFHLARKTGFTGLTCHPGLPSVHLQRIESRLTAWTNTSQECLCFHVNRRIGEATMDIISGNVAPHTLYSGFSSLHYTFCY